MFNNNCKLCDRSCLWFDLVGTYDLRGGRLDSSLPEGSQVLSRECEVLRLLLLGVEKVQAMRGAERRSPLT